jgi:hypothetical protein
MRPAEYKQFHPVCRRHRWREVGERLVLPSFMEEAVRTGHEIKSYKPGAFGDPSALSHKDVIVTLECADCGAQDVRRV